MKRLTVTQAKPNPIGKDRFGHLTPNQQLVGEWVDFKNTGDEGYPLTDIALYHIAYTREHPQNGEWHKVMTFNGTLGTNATVRVHSGDEIPSDQLPYEDRVGAEHHLFTGDNYIWNNDKADTARLRNEVTLAVVDQATYGANPPEGTILKRSGDYLI